MEILEDKLDISLVLLAAGSSTRFGLPVKKQWLRLGDAPLWVVVARDLARMLSFKKIVIVGDKNELKFMREFESEILGDFKDENFDKPSSQNSPEIEFVSGGELRQNSVLNALEMVSSEYVLVHDSARVKVSKSVIQNLVSKARNFDCVSPFLSVNDATYLGESLVEREELKLIQTPQLSKTSLLKKALKNALETKEIFTDDSVAVASMGGKLGFIEGDKNALKLTRKSDLKALNLPLATSEIFSGIGFDTHALKSGDGLMMCGVKVACEFSFIAHSDGDAGIHALIDAMLGAAGLGDIGEHFPDWDEKFRGVDSKILLKQTINLINSLGFKFINADITIIAQKPKLSEYKLEMRRCLAKILGSNKVNIKATTNEKLGYLGRGEGISALAVANLGYFRWDEL